MMYQFDRYERPEALPQSGAYLTAEEIKELTHLMGELRSLTLSRGTFKATCSFLARFGGERSDVSLVTPELT